MTLKKTLSISAAIVLCSIALIAQGASASSLDGYSSVSAITGPSSVNERPETGYSSVSAIGGPANMDTAGDTDGYSSVSSITGPAERASETALVSESPPVTSDGFDWGSAAVGAAAGAGLAALLAGSLALITLRRRTSEVSASTS